MSRSSSRYLGSLLLQRRWFPGSLSPLSPSFSSFFICVATFCGPPEMLNGSSPPVSVLQYNSVWRRRYTCCYCCFFFILKPAHLISLKLEAFLNLLVTSHSSVSSARSPVFSHLSSSLQGLWTIRAFGEEERFQKVFDAHQDLHSGSPQAWHIEAHIMIREPKNCTFVNCQWWIVSLCRGLVPVPDHLSLVCCPPWWHLLRLCYHHYIWLSATQRQWEN